MSSNYRQTVNSAQTHFTKAPMGELEFSTWRNRVRNLTTFSAGEIVPIFDMEILPHDTISMDMDYVIRQATISVPTMDVLYADFYAFFVPNRVVNKSWKNVMGENSSGAWFNDEQIVLAPLVSETSTWTYRPIPVGSVADHYNFPTQDHIPKEILTQCHDLKFRGYLEIYNTYFRDQNYQPPIPYSKLNIYNAFFADPSNVNSLNLGLTGPYTDANATIPANTTASGQYGAGAVVKEIYGEGNRYAQQGSRAVTISGRRCRWSALSKPLKANKLHDYFTSVLPSPQKGRQVSIPLNGDVRLNTSSTVMFKVDNPLRLGSSINSFTEGSSYNLYGNAFTDKQLNVGASTPVTVSGLESPTLDTTNLFADLTASQISIPIEDIRMSSALQQVYEILGRGGSRYTEYINSFFGLDIDNPFDDIPTYLGHFRNELDLYQTAQTSATNEGVGTPQGNLSAFGYTSKGGNLFTHTFKEHGYLHIMCVVRQKNTYASMLSRDNFRMNMFDFYQYPLANISEQPVLLREINPFASDSEGVWGYQEAWAEYRLIPDRVSGHLRPQLETDTTADSSLSYWTYADKFDPALQVATGSWLQSNAEEVVGRTTALQDEDLPQFKGQFFFNFKIERAMPTYSVAGLDII